MGDYNVFFVDWDHFNGDRLLHYFEAAEAVRPVGAHAANLGQYQCEGVGLVSVDGLVYIRGVN